MHYKDNMTDIIYVLLGFKIVGKHQAVITTGLLKIRY